MTAPSPPAGARGRDDDMSAERAAFEKWALSVPVSPDDELPDGRIVTRLSPWEAWLARGAIGRSAPALLAALEEVTDGLEAAYDDGQGARPTAISASIHRARAALSAAREGGQR